MTTETLSHIERYLRRVMLNEKHPRAGDLTLTEYELITSIDARNLFDLCTDLDILFVYFKRGEGRELNACFQRCALNCRPSRRR